MSAASRPVRGAAPAPAPRRAAVSGLLARVGGYASSSLLTGLASVALIPLLTAAAGGAAWSGIAFGQSLGSLAAVFVSLGWVVTGPAESALLEGEARRRYLRDSIATRLLVLPVVATAAGLLAGALSPHAPVPSGLYAAATALTGLSSSWYFVGTRSPRHLLLLEALPRGLAPLAGAALVLAGLPLWVFPVVAAAGLAVSPVLCFTLLGGGRAADLAASLRRTGATLRAQAHGFSTSAVSSLYLNLPTIAVGVLAPAALPQYALVDRLFRMANTGASPAVQVFQGWIPSREPAELRRRIVRGARGAAVLGLAGGALFVVLALLVGRPLSHGEITPDAGVVALFGLILATTVTSQVTGLACLVALGAARTVSRSALLGAAVGVPLLAVGTLVLGGRGAALSVALAELAVLALQLVVLRRLLRR